MSIQRPVISGNDRIWRLNGQSDTANGYETTSTPSVNPNGASGSTSWSASQGAAKVSFSCTSSCGTSVTVTSQDHSSTAGCSGNPSQFDIKIKTSFGGFNSEEFPMFINTPSHLFAWSAQSFPGCTVDENAVDCPVVLPGAAGYDSEIFYRVIDQCNFKMAPIKMNEKFTTSGSDFSNEDWPLPTATGWDGFTTMWEWSDIVRAICVPCTPNSQVPQSPLSSTKVDWVIQEILPGSKTSGLGVHVRTHRQQTYVDHGRHE